MRENDKVTKLTKKRNCKREKRRAVGSDMNHDYQETEKKEGKK